MHTLLLKSKKFINLSLFIAFMLLLTVITKAQNGVGIGTSSPKSNLDVNGSYGQKVTTITANTTLDETYNTVLCNNGNTAITITLPNCSTCTGRVYTIKRGSGNTDSTVFIATSSSETIDGATSISMTDAQGAISLISTGTEWKIMSQFLAPYPMGEVSYFNTTGTTVTISAQSNGTTNMVKCAATTTLNTMSDFDNGGGDNGRLRYIGKTPRAFHIACTISVSPVTASDQFVFGVAANGGVFASSKIIQKMGATTDAQSTAMHVMITLYPGDYLELYVGNMTAGRNVIIKSINLFALGM